MRVQLTPWEMAETSLPLPPKRRRKRSTSNGSSSSRSSPASPLIACFVSGRRSSRHSKKARMNGFNGIDDVQPTLVVTSDHRIRVLGKSSTNEFPALQESPRMQYSSRPGSATAFLSSTSSIPAVVDTKHEQVYALQHENTRLSAWSMNSDGPDSTQSRKLPNAAVSLSLLTVHRTSLAYGSLEDGSLYLANTSDDNRQVHVLPAVNDGHHVATVGLRPKSNHEASKAGFKRKSDSETVTETLITFYQLFVDQHNLILTRRHLDLANQESWKEGKAQSVVISLVQSDDDCDSTIDNVRFLGLAEDLSAVALLYRCSDAAKESSKQYCVSVSLDTARLLWTPWQVPASIHQAGLVSSSVLVGLTTTDELVLYDVQRGAPIGRHSLNDAGMMSEDLMLITDPKRGRVAIVFPRNSMYHVALAAIMGRLSLATGLALSSTGPVNVERLVGVDQPNDLTSLDYEQSSKLQDATRRGIELIAEACRLICDGSKNEKRESLLLEAYEGAVDAIVTAIESNSSVESNSTGENPQDAILSKQGNVNGVHSHHAENGQTKKSLATTTMLVNGLILAKSSNKTKSRAKTPATLPAVFIDQVTSMIVQILCLEEDTPGVETAREDARLLLQRLVRSGKVSARFQFGSDSGIFLDLLRCMTVSGDQNSRYSPVDLIFDLFRYCSDVSEKQMVTMLHYLLSYASPGQIASTLIRRKKSDPDCLRLCNRYVELQAESAQPKKDDGVGLDLVSFKLIAAGTTALLETIISFSDCNESLLHRALSDELQAKELGLLNQILADSLIPSTSDAVKARRAIQWVSVLCDRLRSTKPRDVDVSRVQQSVALELSRMQSLLALQEQLAQSLASIDGSGSQETKDDAPALEPKVSGPLPLYHIERLVF